MWAVGLVLAIRRKGTPGCRSQSGERLVGTSDIPVAKSPRQTCAMDVRGKTALHLQKASSPWLGRLRERLSGAHLLEGVAGPSTSRVLPCKISIPGQPADLASYRVRLVFHG